MKVYPEGIYVILIRGSEQTRKVFSIYVPPTPPLWLNIGRSQWGSVFRLTVNVLTFLPLTFIFSVTVNGSVKN